MTLIPTHTTPESTVSTTTDRRTSGRSDEMPDPDNLVVDRFALPVPPPQLRPAPAIGEHLSPARHRADFSRSA